MVAVKCTKQLFNQIENTYQIKDLTHLEHRYFDIIPTYPHIHTRFGILLKRTLLEEEGEKCMEDRFWAVQLRWPLIYVKFIMHVFQCPLHCFFKRAPTF